MERQAWRNWLGATMMLTGAVPFCVRYVDRPVARALSDLHAFNHLFTSDAVGFPLLLLMAGGMVALTIGNRLIGRSVPRWMTAGTIAALALLLSVAATEYVLKPIFGRTIPRAYIAHGRYGFEWFHYGNAFGSFPSGHSDQAAAILSVLWVFYPRWRWGYVVAFALLSLALMIGEWHFLSDILAGGYVGVVAGAATMAAWRQWTPVRDRNVHRVPGGHPQAGDG